MEAVSDWTVREYRPDLGEGDENVIVYMWLKSYANSAYGKACGADVQNTPNEMAYWMRHRVVVLDALEACGARVLCDPNNESSIWAWACVDPGELVVHYVSVKRSMAKLGLVREAWDALVGDLVSEPCRLTHELAEFRSKPWRAEGMRLPATWYLEEQHEQRQTA